jgi:O-antigen ligase
MEVNRALQYAILTGLFSLTLVPIIVANSLFFPFITGKHFYFRIIVEIIFALWLILALRDARFRPTWSLLAIAIGGWIAVMAVATLFGANPFKSFWSNFERMEGYLTLLHLAMLFLVASTTITTQRLWSALAHTALGVSALMVLYGFLQLSGVFEIHQGSQRIDATIGNAAYFGAYLLFQIFITAILWVRVRGGLWLHALYASMLTLQVVILFYTATRGAILGLLAGTLTTVLFIALFERTRLNLRRSAFLGLTILALLIGSFFFVRDTEFIRSNAVFSRLADISLTAGATRFTIWGIAWEGVKERPLLGWGQENFNLVFNKYYDPSLYAQEPWFDRVHNIVLDWLIAGGFLGALAYFSIPGAALYLMWSARGRELFSPSERSVLTGLLAGYFFQNLFIFDQIVTYLYYFSILAYIASRRGAEVSVRSAALPAYARMAVSVLVLIALVTSLYYVNIKGLQTSTSLIAALHAAGSGNVSATALAFEKAVSKEVVGLQEAREQLVFAANNMLGLTQVSEEEKFKLLNLARREIENELLRAPDDARLHIFKGALLRSAGAFSDAEAALKRARELSPGKPLIHLELAPVFLSAGKNTEALLTCEEALTLAPLYFDAHVTCGAVALYAGDTVRADSWLWPYEDPSGMRYPADDYRAQSFLSVPQRVLYWQRRFGESPYEETVRNSFLGVYREAGRLSEARMAIEARIATDPAFKTVGEAMLNEVEILRAATSTP